MNSTVDDTSAGLPIALQRRRRAQTLGVLVAPLLRKQHGARRDAARREPRARAFARASASGARRPTSRCRAARTPATSRTPRDRRCSRSRRAPCAGSGAAACARKNGARRLSAITSSHCSAVTSPNGVRTMTAAEFTSTSRPPNVAATRATSSAARVGRASGRPGTRAPSPPADSISRTVSSRAVGRRVVVHGDAHAARAERHGDRAPDTMSRARDERDASTELHRHPPVIEPASRRYAARARTRPS